MSKIFKLLIISGTGLEDFSFNLDNNDSSVVVGSTGVAVVVGFVVG